jgi:sugar transferase (PEP-CTERM/EpsH1 system associated)
MQERVEEKLNVIPQESRTGPLRKVADPRPEPVAPPESLPQDSEKSAIGPRGIVEPLRVLHVFTHLGMGGTELGILRVVAGLSGKQFQHRLCTLRGFDPDFVGRNNLSDKVFVAGRADGKSQFPLFRLMAIMKCYEPHIVHSRNWGAIEAVPAARLAGVPVVIHSEHGYEVDMLRGLPVRRRLLRRALYPLADAVFTVTEELRQYHGRQAWVSADRIRVIYNGVDTERFSPCPETRVRMRKKLGLTADTFVIGTVGRMVPIKDQKTLLRAAELLIRRGTDVYVLLLGAGPERPLLENYVHASAELNGHVTLLGVSDSVPELLQSLDVFVLPSLCEGFSNTLLEAMACGLPTVATRVGGNPEIVGENHSAWLFSPGDVSGLAERLERFARSGKLGIELGAAARQRALAHFGRDHMMKQYRDLYFTLAQRRGLLARS